MGGADRLSDLIEKIHEWAACEGGPDDLAVRLVSDPPMAPPVNPFSVTGLYRPRSAGTHGVITAGPAWIPVLPRHYRDSRPDDLSSLPTAYITLPGRPACCRCHR